MMFLLILILGYVAGAAATFYGLIRWGDMDPNGWDADSIYWISGTWMFSIPFIALVFSVCYVTEKLANLAKRDAQKDKSNES